MTLSIGIPAPDCGRRRTVSLDRRNALAPLTEGRGRGVTSPNGEETRYGMGFAANYHKSLPHDVLGNVHCDSYHLMVRVLSNNESGAIETLPVGANRRGAGTATDPARTTVSPREPLAYRKLTSPLTGHVFDTQGADAAAFAIGAAPTVASVEFAAEMAELYSMALLRDVSFSDIADASGPNVASVVNALGGMEFFQSDYEGRTEAERRRHKTRGTIVSGADLFRGSTPGSKHGHWVSQFMLVGNSNDAADFRKLDGTPFAANGSGASFRGVRAEVGPNDGFVFFGTQIIDQRSIVAKPKLDFMTNWASWLDCQNGVDFNGFDQFLGERRYLFTPRDIATYVHFDALYQAYLVACLLMASDGRRFPKDRGLPETSSRTRAAFASFGGPHILSLVTEVATRALKAVWRQKWLHHRRMRPEVAAAMITLHAHDATLIENAELRDAVGLLRSRIPPDLLAMIAQHNDAQNAAPAIKPKTSLPSGFPDIANSANYLLPMAFPEGSPTHPAYGAGHATVAGACVTVLKAFFDMYAEDGVTERPWPLPVYNVKFQPGSAPAGNQNEGGELRQIAPANASHGYTVQGELDKLTMNIANARNMAGVHYYTDYYESLRLGERIAVGILEEQLSLYDEPVTMRFTSFDGDDVRISSNGDLAVLQIVNDGVRSNCSDWYGRLQE